MRDAPATLLAAILESPDDDDLRLVYADALELAGDLDHAEFVRLGIAVARNRASEGDAARVEELERAHGKRFAGPWIVAHAEGWSFDRGLVGTIRGIRSPVLAANADAILGSAPVRTLVLGDVEEEEDDEHEEEDPGPDGWSERTRDAARTLAACPHLGRLVTLDMSEGSLGDAFDEGERLRFLLASPYLTKLETIRIGTECSTNAAIAIAEAETRLPSLRELRFGAPLGSGRVGNAGAKALAASPLSGRLEVLEILASDISDEGFVPLARSFRALRQLWLGGTWYVQNPIGAAGARALAESPGVARLEFLDLAGAGIGDEGAVAIASAPWLASVRYLDLADNNLTDRSALAFAQSPFATRLEFFSLAYGTVDPGRPNTISEGAVDTMFARIGSLADVRLGPDSAIRRTRTNRG